MWDSKPEPFRADCPIFNNPQQEWLAHEREARKQLDAARQEAASEMDESGEIETRKYVYRGRNVYCEKFHQIDWKLNKPTKNSNLLAVLNDSLSSWSAENPSPSDKAVQYTTAMALFEKKGKKTTKKGGKTGGSKIDKPLETAEMAYQELYASGRDSWSKVEQEFDTLNNSKEPKSEGDKAWYLKTVVDNWKMWRVTDKILINHRNRYASTKDGILRTPPENELYLALDKHGSIFIFLDPEGLYQAFGEDIVARMLADTKLFYSPSLKIPNPKENKRHLSQRLHMESNPHLKEKECGSEHYGHWHARGHSSDEPIVETADSLVKGAALKQLLLQYLHYTVGSMTRVLDFWFGVWDPELREEYRRVYRDSPRFARLPPTNDDHDETYTLRVIISNRPTDEHVDKFDWEKGLTGLCQIGNFQGAAMCFNQIGLKLNGYKSGAVLLIRGGEISHYIAPWKGECRYAFDHTTHKTVRETVDRERDRGSKSPANSSTNNKKRKLDATEDSPSEKDEPGSPAKKRKARGLKAENSKSGKVVDDEAAGQEEPEGPARTTKAKNSRAKKATGNKVAEKQAEAQVADLEGSDPPARNTRSKGLQAGKFSKGLDK